MTTHDTWRTSPRKEEQPQNKPKFEPFKKPKPTPSTTQGNREPISSKTHDIKCFKCQGHGHIASQCVNKRVMVINAQDELESEDKDEIVEEVP